MRKIFITGITGSLGQAVSKKLLEAPENKIIGFSRDEQKQRALLPHKNQTLVLGDVRDQRRVLEATRDCDYIFHFAALKCVDTLEANPEESIATNVLGTENIMGAQRTNKIKSVVLSSTDKAVYPINVYGNCKALAEKLVLRNSHNVVVRYGNVMASRGSAIPYFIKTLKEEGKIYITDKNMTRFFIRIEDAAQFVIDKAFGSVSGLHIFNMKSISIIELGMAISEIIGVKKPNISITGIRPGEKIHEDLIAHHEGIYLNSDNSKRYSKKEIFKMLEPLVANA